MKNLILIIIIFFALLVSGYGQKVTHSSHESALPWVKGNLPKINTNAYYYKVVQGDGDNLSKAQDIALGNLLFELGTQNNVHISSNTILEVEEQIDNAETNLYSNFKKVVTIDQEGFMSSFSRIDEYYEVIKDFNGNNIYRCWQLYAISKYSNFVPPTINYSTRYGFDAGYRSALIPGWGQLYKNEKGKGVVFLTGTALSVSSSIYSQNKYRYNLNRSKETPTLSIQKEFVDRAEKWAGYRDLSIGAVAVVWVWNVIDAIATDGAPKYAFINRKIQFDILTEPNSTNVAGLKYNF